MSNIIDVIPLPPLYYHARDTSYWRQAKSGGWIKVNDTSAKNFVAEYGYKKSPKEPGTNSEVDKAMMNVQSDQNVAYVGSLAGYDAGIQLMASNRVLVTDSPKFIKPAEGTWPTLTSLFEGMFVDGEIDQRPYFYGWIKNALQSFEQRRWKASQLLALAGPVGSGKSLTQNLITAMFGGRAAKPYQFMMGHTTFNAHMFTAEHLMLEDEAESVDIRSRRHFAANIKTILTNWEQNCHGKNKDAVILKPLWRMTLSLNDDPERLQVLPPLDSDVREKIIALKVARCDMPMPTSTPEQEEAFWARMMSELPAFLHYVKGYAIPTDLVDTRYGIKAYHHPEIVEKLEQTSPELQLMELIDKALFGNRFVPEAWEGTSADLEERLQRGDYEPQVKRLLRHQNTCGTYLGRLKECDQTDIEGRITSHKHNGHMRWTIQPPARAEVRRDWQGEPTDEVPPAPPQLAVAE